MSDTAKSLYTIYLLFTIAETIMLMAGGMSLYDSLITTFGSVGTGGLSNYSDSMGHFDSTYLRMVVTGSCSCAASTSTSTIYRQNTE